MAFPCSMCGCCCKRVDKAAIAFGYLDDASLHFPYGWDTSGRCDKLTPDNKCSEYSNRPLMCDIDRLMNYFSISRKNFYNENATACNEMMKEDGIDPIFNITLPIQ